MKYWILFLLAILLSCKKVENTNSEKTFETDREYVALATKVEVSIVQKRKLTTEIRSNGILRANKKVEVKFEFDGKIEEINVTDGKFVKKGDILARQNSTLIQLEKDKQQIALSKAQLEKEDLLLSLGYTKSDTIPEKIHRMALIKSNILEIEIQLKETNEKMKAAIIRAPFSGRIGNVEAQVHNFSSDHEKICTLIDDKQMLVEFNILEEEYNLIQKGDQVIIYPSNGFNKKHSGYISQINPMVDENGFINVKALVSNNQKKNLIDGMHVNVLIQKYMGKQIVLPKEAIVIREGKRVAFTYKDGMAIWNYVSTSFENKDSICIIDGLSLGDSLITSNNINLSHQMKVELQ